MSDPHWLFTYGTLGPEHHGAGRTGWQPDAVRGRLYDLGPYPALVGLDDPGAGWVEGHVRPVDPRELTAVLDPYEGVAEGLYDRVATLARSGRAVWVYVYRVRLPETARGPLTRWNGPRREGSPLV